MNQNKLIVIIFSCILAGVAVAAISTNYILSPEGLFSSGGNAGNTSNAIGENVIGEAGSTNYQTELGFLAASSTYSTQEPITPQTPKLPQGIKILSYPNPFDPKTQSATITYNLSSASNISIYIFSITGELVWKNNFASGSTGAQAGENSINWDGRTISGTLVDNGVYICKITAKNKVIGTTKIVILK